MKAGDLTVHGVEQSDGSLKTRPVVLLKQMRPFGDWLVCAVSTQLQQEVKGFDVLIPDTNHSFASTGLKRSSLIQLGVINTVSNNTLAGAIGSLDPKTIVLLQQRLASYLIK
jgi:mRNA interferase MazF